MKKIIFAILIIFSNTIYLNAKCDEEFNNAIKSQLTAEYIESHTDEGELYIQVVFGPIYEFTYAKVSNNKDNIVTIYNENDTDNFFAYIKSTDIYENIKYKIEFYLNTAECEEIKLKTLEVTTPKLNLYSALDLCQENKEFDLCKPFYNVKNISKKEFYEKINDYIEDKNKTDKQILWENIQRYAIYVIIPVVSIVLIYTYKIVKFKRAGKL